MFWLKKTLGSVYIAMFNSHLCYTSLVWDQNANSIKRLHLLQKKFPGIISIKRRNSNTVPLFKGSQIQESFGKTTLENFIFIGKSSTGLSSSVIN